MDDIDNWATEKSKATNMERVIELHTDLSNNISLIDNVNKNIAEAEASNDIETMEDLYQKEFMLYMDNIGIFDDLIQLLDTVDKTPENEFELARIRRSAIKMCRVEIVEVL